MSKKKKSQAEDLPVEDPQAEDLPVEDPQAEDPQAEDPQAEDPQAEDPQAEDPPRAVEPEQIVTRRGTSVGGTRSMTRSEYDKEIARERGSDEESE